MKSFFSVPPLLPPPSQTVPPLPSPPQIIPPLPADKAFELDKLLTEENVLHEKLSIAQEEQQMDMDYIVKIKNEILENLTKQTYLIKRIDTEIQHDGPIYALSDIHGDFHAFLISLRDCANVIQKKSNQNYNRDNVEQIDPYIETNLNINISADDNDFDETFGYEWSGGNSYVVICGDIIDPYRPGYNNCLRAPRINCTNYPQIEIKILRFINEMNAQAKKVNGKIFKLLGNHEFNNINSSFNEDIYSGYRFDINHDYGGISRKELFNYGEEGYNLLFKDHCYTLLKINGNIFVHGELPEIKLEEIKMLNDIINTTRYFSHKFNIEIYNDWLYNRTWASPDMITTRINDNTVDDFCGNNVIRRLQNFMNIDDINIDEVYDLRVILGHCIQASYDNKAHLLYDYTKEEIVRPVQNWRRGMPRGIHYNTTFNNLIHRDHIIDVYNGETIYENRPANDFQNINNIFGITMQCKKPGVQLAPVGAAAAAPLPQPDDFFVYHVDIGSSRAFDEDYEKTQYTELGENQHFYSRTPQVLLIENTNKICIIKSRMKNTRTHLPRPDYELEINRISAQFKLHNPHNPLAGHELSLDDRRYLKKYLKYKQKYLLLKEKYTKII